MEEGNRILKTDVIVVGAGPAGSIAAKTIACEGYEVIIIDKEKFPRLKPCGGGLPIRVLSRYPFIKNLNVIESYSYEGNVYSRSLKNSVKFQKKDPVLAMIRRDVFDNALLDYAKKHGAIFIENKKVVDIERNNEYACAILDDNTKIFAKIIIGADGFISTIAKKSGLLTHHKYMGKCVVEEFKFDKKIIDEYFTDNRICHLHSQFHGMTGYGWVFPKKNHINIGLVKYNIPGMEKVDAVNLKNQFDSYLSILKNTNVIPENIKSEKLQGGLLPLFPLEKTFSDKTILCGDAAGFINPVSGEGLYYALVSGGIAGNVAVDSLKCNNTTESFLSLYEKLWKNDFGKDIRIYTKTRKIWSKNNEKMVILMNKDKKLAELLSSIMTGQYSISKKVWAIIFRYILASLKLKILR